MTTAPGTTPAVTDIADTIAPLRRFVVGMTELVGSVSDEATLLARGKPLLAALLADDAWLPDEFAQPAPSGYRQFLLHCDPLERFSVVSFVWGPGVSTPVHDHMTWGLVGVLRGCESAQAYKRGADGRMVPDGAKLVARPGDIEAVSPTIGDVHVVANELTDRASVSIHVYGANIGAVRRHTFDAATGAPKTFVSGYTGSVIPNLWDRSAQARAAG
jgi:3-mercaptopropionate dioxygenase